MAIGVYCWKNRINGKVYVGSSAVCIVKRRKHYLTVLPRGYCHNKHLQNAWKFYGAKKFVFSILERCPSELCLEREQYWMDKLKAADRKFGYNASPTAGNCFGMKRSEETKRKLSEFMKRPEVIARLTAAKRTPEFRALASRVQTGRVISAEHRRKLAVAATGKHPSPEAIEKTAAANRGRKHPPRSPESIARIIAGSKRRYADGTAGAAHSIKMKGRKMSEETKAKMSASQKKAWIIRRRK